MTTKNFTDKVNYFISLRKDSLSQRPFDIDFMPASESEAYEIQKEVVNKLRLPIVGWKLGGTNCKTQTNFGCKSGYLGPVFSVNDTKPTFFNSHELRGEAELTFRLNERISELSIYKIISDPLQFFDMVYPSLELPFSNINNFKTVGMLPLIADLCGTGHLSLGEPSPLKALSEVNFRVSIMTNGSVVTNGSAENLIGGYRAALVDFLKLSLKYGFNVKAGQFVATGGITDCIEIDSNTLIDVQFEGLGMFSVSYS